MSENAEDGREIRPWGEAHARLSRIFALDSHLPANPFRHSFGHKAYFHWDYFLNRDFSGVLKTFADRVGDRYIDLVGVGESRNSRTLHSRADSINVASMTPDSYWGALMNPVEDNYCAATSAAISGKYPNWACWADNSWELVIFGSELGLPTLELFGVPYYTNISDALTLIEPLSAGLS
ncbi:hypothetical protein [Arthrobacter woluwensis]|uniref:hypothetical protein n=1 Tax=Arthrobacter woluwensis TaxID=156980 RepID=UPI00111475F0|nr:hypothetical protein [Arthrobacter woluwensis]